MNKQFLTINEVANKLKIHRNTVSNMIKDGRIKTTDVGGRKLIHSYELDNLKNGTSHTPITLEIDTKIQELMIEIEKLNDERSLILKNYMLDGLKSLRVGVKEGETVNG